MISQRKDAEHMKGVILHHDSSLTFFDWENIGAVEGLYDAVLLEKELGIYPTKKRSDIAASDPKSPAAPSERIKGSSKNTEGSASASGGDIELSEATVNALEEKVSAHNEAHPEKGKRATVGALKKVWRRGAGAFSTSHRRTVKSRSQWAMGRVNAYLYLLRNGKPKNRNYTTDNDLLPAGHPRSSRKDELPFQDGEWDAIANDIGSQLVVEEALSVIDGAVGNEFSGD